MGDWRDESADKKRPKKSKTTDEKPGGFNLPPAKQATSPGTSRSDWRSKGKKTTLVENPSRDRNWTRREIAPQPIRGMSRITRIAVYAGLLAVTTVFFWIVMTKVGKPLPVVVSNAKSFTPLELQEHPFSQNDVAFKQANNKQLVILEDPKRDFNVHLQDIRSKNKIKGGGPGKPGFVAFYVSGFIAQAPTNGNASTEDSELIFLSSDTRAFEPNSASKSDMKLIGMLENMQSAVAKDSMVWITLDVRPVPAFSNPAARVCPLAHEVNEWFKKLSEDEKNRTIITLPCSDTQENWIAPELSSTVLGYFYRMGLNGGFEKNQNLRTDRMSLKKFREELTQRVENWVRDRRYARQELQWIMSDDTTKRADQIQILSTEDVQHKPGSSNVATEMPQRYEEVDKRWENLQRMVRSYRWDPLNVGIAEAHLLRLEDLIEGGASDEAVEDQKRIVGESLGRLGASAARSAMVSLIETRGLSEFAPTVSTEPGEQTWANLDALAANWIVSTPWIPSTKPAETTAKSEEPNPTSTKDTVVAPANSTSTPANLNAAARCYLVWKTLQLFADSKDVSQSSRIFSEASLKWCLEFAKGNENPDWLEFHLVNLLINEIDWDPSVVNADRTNACSGFVSAFDRIQRLATDPNHELSWWLRKDIMNVDQAFLKAVDLLLGGRFSECNDGLADLNEQIKQLDSKNHILKTAMQARDEAMWLTPHLLAYQLRRYQFADSSDETTKIEGSLRDLGDIVTEARKLAGLLSPTFNEDAKPLISENSEIAITSEQLEKLLRKQREAFAEFKSSLVAAPKANPKTIRDYRIVLRCPLLEASLRKQFHANLVEYFENPEKDLLVQTPSESKSTMIENYAIGSALRIFGEQVRRTDSLGEVYGALAKGRLGLSSLVGLSARPEPTGKSDIEILEALYSQTSQTRLVALTFGAFPSYRRMLEYNGERTWPWSAPRQFLSLSRNHFNQTQALRLAQAAWGNSDLDEVSAETVLYHQLAARYLANVGEEFQATAAIERMTGQATQKELEETHGRLSNLRVKTGQNLRPEAKGQTLDVKIPLDKPWSARPTICLEHRRPFEFDNPRRRMQLLDLSKDADQKMKVDVTQSSVRLRLSMRGNYRNIEVPIVAAQQGGEYRIASRRAKISDPTVLVKLKQDETTSIMLLLDCSESMTKIQPGGVRTAFEDASATTRKLIHKIGEIHQRGEAKIELGLMLFGYRDSENSTPYGFTRTESEQVYSTNVKAASPELIAQLNLSLDHSLPSGYTPLYDAITIAARKLPSKSLIYVISDGVNFIPSNSDTPKYAGIGAGVERVKEALGNSKVLSIFEFEGENPEQAKDSIKELQEITNKQYSRFKSFEELSKNVIESLPKRSVAIYSNDKLVAQGNFGRPIVVPINGKSVPYPVEIRAEVTVNKVPQKKTQTVELVGGEALQLNFDSSAGWLQFPTLASEDKYFEKTPIPPVSSIGERADLAVLLHPELDTTNFLFFEVGLKQTEETGTFTRRPTMVLGKLVEEGQPEEEGMLVSDWALKPKNHYPILVSPKLPTNKNSNRSGNYTLTLWLVFDDKLPGRELKVPMTSEKTVGPGISVSRGASQMPGASELKVEIASPADLTNRLFLVCPEAEQADHVYKSDRRESHVFRLFESAGAETPLRIISENELRQAVNNGKISEYKFHRSKNANN